MLGTEKMERIRGAKIAVIGDGVAAQFAIETLARSGVGSIDAPCADEKIISRVLSLSPDIIIGASVSDMSV